MDFKLGQNSHDLVFEDGDFAMVEEEEELAQHLKVSHNTNEGEWAFNVEFGIDYLGSVFVKNPNLSEVASLYRQQIEGRDGVVDIVEFRPGYDPANREFILEYTVLTFFGEITQQYIASTGTFWSNTIYNS